MRSRTAAELKDHLRGDLGANLREGRINAALEAVARIGNDAELPPRGRRAQGIEIRRFHENIRGCFRAARMFAADNAGNAFGGRVIGDHRHLRGERIGLAIKRCDFFAIPGHARPDIALHLVRIEDMQRPAIGKGDVVGDIDQRGNRPSPMAFKPPLQPFRRRVRFSRP